MVNRMEAVAARATNIAKTLIEKLQKSNADCRELQQLLSAESEGRIVAVRAAKRARSELRELHAEFRTVSSEAKASRKKAEASAKDTAEREAQVVALREELTKQVEAATLLQGQLTTVRADATALAEACRTSQADADALHNELSASRAAATAAAATAKEAATQAAAQAAALLHAVRNEAAAARGDAAAASSRTAALHAELDAARAETALLAAARDETAALRETVTALAARDKELEAARSDAATAREEATAAREELTKLQGTALGFLDERDAAEQQSEAAIANAAKHRVAEQKMEELLRQAEDEIERLLLAAEGAAAGIGDVNGGGGGGNGGKESDDCPKCCRLTNELKLQKSITSFAEKERDRAMQRGSKDAPAGALEEIERLQQRCQELQEEKDDLQIEAEEELAKAAKQVNDLQQKERDLQRKQQDLLQEERELQDELDRQGKLLEQYRLTHSDSRVNWVERCGELEWKAHCLERVGPPTRAAINELQRGFQRRFDDWEREVGTLKWQLNEANCQLAEAMRFRTSAGAAFRVVLELFANAAEDFESGRDPLVRLAAREEAEANAAEVAEAAEVAATAAEYPAVPRGSPREGLLTSLTEDDDAAAGCSEEEEREDDGGIGAYGGWFDGGEGEGDDSGEAGFGAKRSQGRADDAGGEQAAGSEHDGGHDDHGGAGSGSDLEEDGLVQERGYGTGDDAPRQWRGEVEE